MDGYAGKWADINLSNRTVSYIEFPEKILREYLGGIGIGARILYDRVKPGTEWDSPENCLIIAGGPLNGINLAGSGAFCAVTKGPLTNGATSVQANGFFGAYLKKSGLDGLIIEGAADDWVYLHIGHGVVEIRDAGELSGLDTLETEEKVKELIDNPGHQSSVFGIGPAGEKLVKFAALVGDKGHVAGHNGVGAVLGSKKLKAMAVERGNTKTPLFDLERVSNLSKQIIADAKENSAQMEKGTSHLLKKAIPTGILPYKNLTSNVVGDEYLKLGGEYYREKFDLKREPCYACPSSHCHQITVTEGPYKGFTGDEPEYELMAGMGSLIGNSDPGAAIMLSNELDRVGVDGNEGSWLCAFVIEMFERGILNVEDTDGLELRWGNVEAVRALIHKIANREGIGNILAEGVMRAARHLGGEALNIAVYQNKGHAPRGHDHRSRWTEMFDTAVSGCGTIESTHTKLSPDDAVSPEAVANALHKGKTRCFVDSLVVCMFPTQTMTSMKIDHLVELINAATGWDYSGDEAAAQSLRVVNLLRAFNVRHGITPEVERPSVRYGSVPADGPSKGRDVMQVWDETLDRYYNLMGWDRVTGRPRQETLQKLGLGDVVRDLY